MNIILKWWCVCVCILPVINIFLGTNSKNALIFDTSIFYDGKVNLVMLWIWCIWVFKIENLQYSFKICWENKLEFSREPNYWLNRFYFFGDVTQKLIADEHLNFHKNIYHFYNFVIHFKITFDEMKCKSSHKLL